MTIGSHGKKKSKKKKRRNSRTSSAKLNDSISKKTKVHSHQGLELGSWLGQSLGFPD